MTFSRRAARAATATVTTVLLACVAPGALGQEPSPSSSPSASPPAEGELGVTLLNPSTAYDETPKVSDRFDGTDTAYTIVARTTGTADAAIVEASLAPQNGDGTFGNEVTIGQLERVPGSDVWELDWDIPSSVEEGPALFSVRAFVATPSGFVETAAETIEIDVSYSDPTTGPVGAWETVDIRWPRQNGVLGFYKPRVGAWRTVVDGTTSAGANTVQLYFSTSPPGEPLTFRPCGAVAPVVPVGAVSGAFSGRCSLDAATLPSQVRAVAAVADLRDPASATRIPQGGDARVVRPYDVSPEDMSVRITPVARRVVAPAKSCQAFTVIVTDENDRLIVGANVDVHATGPRDELILAGSGLRVPDGHSRETTAACPVEVPVESPVAIPTDPRTQGDHNVPSGLDSKHVETNQGTGLDTMLQPSGQTGFLVASEAVGFTELTAWVDDEEIARETDQRPSDNDHLDPGEPAGRARVQWLASAPALSLDPLGGTAPAATCFPYVVKARSGTAVMPGINVDVHATGPGPALDFCDPEGATPRRAPSGGSGANAHEPEQTPEAHHSGSTGPPAQHTEGETDSAGNLVVGLTSPVTGDTSVVAWIDGEPGADDDVQGGAEVSASGTISWVTSTEDAELGFVNPSPYGGTTAGAGTGTQLPDSGGIVDVLVRLDMAEAAPGVEILLSRDNRRTFTRLGDAQRVGSSDLYRLEWPVDLPDGPYSLRARVAGTSVVEDLNVTVGAGERLPAVPNPGFETLEIEEPRAAAGAPFTNRSTLVAGRASAGAEGVDVYYTKVPAKDTPRIQDWVYCGHAALDGTGTTRQEFATPCALAGSDQAAQVTGIAAITFDCTVDGCDANPFPEPPAEGAPAMREQGQKDTGQAVRVFGYEAHPLLAVEPPEVEVETDECRRLEVRLRDQTGQPIGNSNVDLHLQGDAPAHFCRPAGAPGSVRAPDSGGHTTAAGFEANHADGSPGMHAEGETLANGLLVFGVTAGAAGDVALTAWLDRDDDDVQGGDEPSGASVLHWVELGGCSVAGTDQSDVLHGTPGDDVFCALEGDDVIRGGGGHDVVYAGAGSDRVFGGDGRDWLGGGSGRDVLNGGRGRDHCRGGGARDRILRCESGDRAAGEIAARRSGA